MYLIGKILTFLIVSQVLCTLFEEKRKAKIFNLFTIVQFQNDDCVAHTESQLVGTCYSSTECTDRRGRAAGPCASGFGICCVFTDFECGDTISENKTYIRSPNYPSNFVINQAYIEQYTVNNTGGNCTLNEFKCQEPEMELENNSYILKDKCVSQDKVNDGRPDCEDKSDEFVRCKFNVQKLKGDVCNLRLDFEKFDLLAGSGSTDLDSECRDKFEVSNLSTGNFRIPTICGFNTGEHIYIDVGLELNELNRETGFTATIDAMFALVVGTRHLSIRVSQMECHSISNPPAGCLQYFTGLTGRITTFNFNNDKNTPHLDKQDYEICIRREIGQCCIEYSVCQDPNSFTIDNTRYTLFEKMDAVVANGNEAQIASMNLYASSTCTRDWIEISSSNEVCNGKQHFNRYCGFTLSTEIATDTDQNFNNEIDLSQIQNRPHNTICDCSLPFSVGVRTSNENRGGSQNLPNIPPAKIFGQKWDQEVETIQARGVCLNYEQKPCE